MSYKAIINKNSALTADLLDYLASNPDITKDIPSGVSYVVISASDEELNKYNFQLIEHLQGSGKKVVKAIQTNDKDFPWNLNYLN